MRCNPKFLLYTSILLLTGWVGCYTVPETGRKELNFVSVGHETSLGVSAFEKLKSETPLSTDAELIARVQRVGRRIAKAVGSDLPSAEWEFVVFDADETVNAFALPGGKVGVYSGILMIAETDDELAVIMGHEIAHVTARHGSERMSHGIVAGLLAFALSQELSGDKNQTEWLLAYGVLTTVGVMLPFSRSHELEADHIGLIYAAKAGYNPAAGPEFWMKMNLVKEGKEPNEFLSTHPSDMRRIDRLEALLPEVMPIYEEAIKNYE